MATDFWWGGRSYLGENAQYAWISRPSALPYQKLNGKLLYVNNWPKTLLVISIDSRNQKKRLPTDRMANERMRKLLRRAFNDDPRREIPEQRPLAFLRQNSGSVPRSSFLFKNSCPLALS